MENKEIDFVARHYRKGRFSAEAGWRRMGLPKESWWRRYRVAAAVGVAVLLSATAAVVYNSYIISDMPQRQEAPAQAPAPLEQIKVIDFENAPLRDVVAKIEAVYGVKVGNVPDAADSYVLSLHYEGNPAELIAEINGILGTQMIVTEP